MFDWYINACYKLGTNDVLDLVEAVYASIDWAAWDDLIYASAAHWLIMHQKAKSDHDNFL